MKTFEFLFIVLVFICACTEDQVPEGFTCIYGCSDGNVGFKNDKEDSIGWLIDYIPHFDDPNSQLGKIRNSGNWLVLMAWEPSPTFYISKIGSEKWESLVPPTTYNLLSSR